MQPQWRTTTRRLRFQPLEQRTLLAGDVTVAMNGSDLVITGDAQDNQIQVSVSGSDVVVTALDLSTNVFLPTDPLTSSGNVLIDLGDGDNILNVFGLDVGGGLSIDTGTGVDWITVAGTSVNQGDLTINTAEAFDQVILESNGVVAGAIDIDTGDGPSDTLMLFNTTAGDVSVFGGVDLDSVTIVGSGTAVSDVGDDLTVATGDGTDFVILADLGVGGDVVVATGAANDDLNASNVNIQGETLILAGGGNDGVSLQFSTLYSDALVFMGAGNDTMLTVGVSVENGAGLAISTGAGMDDVTMFDTSVTGTAVLLTGGDDDFAFIDDSSFQNLLVSMGGGDDNLLIEGTTVDGLTYLSGGSGTDTLDVLTDNDFNLDLFFETFEILDDLP